MRKLRLVIAAAVVCTAAGCVAVAMAKPHHHKPKKIKVNTKVNLTYHQGHGPGVYDPYNPYNEYDPYGQNASFTGKVKAKKGCARRRSITVSRLGHTSSAKDGQFSFAVDGTAAAPGNYRIRVKGKKFTRGHGKHKRKIKCKPESKTLTIVSNAHAKPKQATHVATKVKIAYSAPAGEYSPDTGFTGKVKAKKGCKSKRTVKLSHYGKTKTSKRGAFAFGVGPSGASPGEYTVKVLEKDVGDDIVCDPVKAELTIK